MIKTSVTAILVLISLSLTACDKVGTFDVKWTPPAGIPAIPGADKIPVAVPEAAKKDPAALPEVRDPAVDAEPAAE